jgi:MFS family permease
MKEHHKLKRNIVLLYPYNILVKRVTMPIIVLYYLLYNLTYTEIGILASILAVFTLLFEVPSGIIADKYGRKNSLLISSIFGVLSTIFYFFGNGFWMFAIATALFGICVSFTSGTFDAFLYDTLVALKKQNQYKKYRSRQFLYSHSVNGLVLLTIPLLYTFDEKLPFLVGLVFFLSSFFVALALVEPPLKRKLGREFAEVFFESGKEIRFTKGLFLIILASAVSLAFIFATSEYYQPLLQIAKIPVTFFGVIYFAKRILLGGGAYLAHKLEKYLKPAWAIVILGILIFVFYIGASRDNSLVIVFSVIFFSLIEGAHRVILRDEIHKRTSSDNRSTVLSFEEFVQNLSKAGIALIYGFLADLIGIQQMLIVGGVLFVIVFVTIICFLFAKKSLG